MNTVGFLRLILLSSFLVAAVVPGKIFAGEKSICPNSSGMVWSDTDGNDEEIFFSSYENNKWSPPFQISDNDSTDYIPVAVTGNDCRTWVFWSRLGERVISLHYRVYFKGTWSEVKQLDTGMESNTAVTVLVGSDNKPWLVWAGFDGKDDDIFWSRWNGLGWSGPERVNVDDEYPDILPAIMFGPDGLPVIQWQGFDGHNYKKFSSNWTGVAWGPELEGQQTFSAKKEMQRKVSEFPALPSFLGDQKKASVYRLDGGSCFSVPLRLFGNR